MQEMKEKMNKKKYKRPGAMRAPLRPRFQRPRTQLVHLLREVQPKAKVYIFKSTTLAALRLVKLKGLRG